MSSAVKIPFKGSMFKMNTGVQSGGFTITGVTRANPGVVSFTGMAPSAGAVVDISGVVGMTELNGNSYVVANPTGSTFELSGIDTSGYAAYTSGGSGVEESFSSICEVKDVNRQGGTAAQSDMSTICSDRLEFVQGLSDSGTLAIAWNFAPNTTAQISLKTAETNGTQKTFMVVLPASRGTIIMFGTVQQSSFQGAVGGGWHANITIKLSGDYYVLAS